MKIIISILALICLSSAVYNGHSPKSVPVPGKYIFQFHPNASHVDRQSFLNNFKAMQGHQVIDEWVIGDFHAFSAETSQAFVNLQMNNELFLVVEQDQTVHALQGQCVTQSGATWGINRISERSIELNGDYLYEYNGEGVDAYIIDTGILISHNEFGGRATWGATFTGDGNNNDCNGHGTHVAGTVGGTVYGVAKKVSLIAVKVLNCAGSGTNAGVINGINYVAQQYNSKGKPSVANMSLGGGFSQATNNAVTAAINAGVVFAVAAGNSNANACNYSPASTPTAISVGSTDTTTSGGFDQDIRSSFSNFGTCTHMFAPGSLITAAWIGSNTATRTISGTSMASPHVAGVAALALQAYPNYTPAQIKTHLINESTKGVINLNCAGSPCSQSPNRLIYSACDVSI